MTDLLTRSAKSGTRHLSVVRDIRVEQHPEWCYSGFLCGGSHAAEAVSIPATAGGFEIIADCAAFPMADVFGSLDEGTPTVVVTIKSPLISDMPRTGSWVEERMTPAEAHTFAAALFSAVCGERATAEVADGASTIVVNLIGEAVVVAVSRDGGTLTAEFRPSEARKLADAVVAAADLVAAPVVWVDVEIAL